MAEVPPAGTEPCCDSPGRLCAASPCPAPSRAAWVRSGLSGGRARPLRVLLFQFCPCLLPGIILAANVFQVQLRQLLSRLMCAGGYDEPSTSLWPAGAGRAGRALGKATQPAGGRGRVSASHTESLTRDRGVVGQPLIMPRRTDFKIKFNPLPASELPSLLSKPQK